MQSWRWSCTRAAAALGLAAMATVTAQAQDPRINELRVGQAGADFDEYFELVGTPDSSLGGIFYIVIGNDNFDGNNGVVEEWVNLTPHAINPSGFYLTVTNFFTLTGTPDLYLPEINFEGGNRTHMLVMNFTGLLDDDLDIDDDGILDAQPWDEIIDCVALVGPGTPGVDGDHVYCAIQVGPEGDFVPGHAYLCDSDLTWTIGDFDTNSPGAVDTPGVVNTSCSFVPPCGSGLTGSCFVANGTPNCDDAECCNLIIDNFDPSCATEWDQLCADLAQLNCLSCGDPEAGDCFSPNGTAYCDVQECCDTVCGIDPSCCGLNGWDQICADLAVANCPLTAVVQDDVVVGLSDPDPAVTLALAQGPRTLLGGTLVNDFWSAPFMQSVEFDNLNGLSHNPAGNLLAVNFGTTALGGEIHILPTCAALGPGLLIGNTTGLGGAGLTLSRLGGISVSPDNDKIAVVGYDSEQVIVFDYVAGDCLVGGALSGARETTDGPMCLADTQGTAWFDNNTVLAFSSTGTLWAVDATTMGTTPLANVAASCGPGTTAVEYNPFISPLAFLMNGEFSGGTTNTLWVLDPANSWGIVNQVDYSTSINTTREIAFDSAGNLLVSQFTGLIEVIVNAAGNAAGLVDNDSLDWFDTETQVGFSSFPGLDVAAGVSDTLPCPWDCQPVPNGNVDVPDFLAILAQWGQVGTSCDIDGGGVSVTDFLIYLSKFGPCP
ncbi:MAG: hypothetical protein ACYSU7_07440 [Planctomycetota bacterium]|jgi:hypothetical protein